MRKLLAGLVLTAALLAPATAQANHPLTRAEAVREFRQHAFDNYIVDYFDRRPACTRFSRYLFRCVAVVIYTDGDSDCIRGPVRATGLRHHRISVRMVVC